MEYTKQLGMFLGLKPEKASVFDLISLTRSGIKVSSAKKLLSVIHLNQEEFAGYTGINPRTLTRRLKSSEKKFSAEETEKVVRLARVYLEALDVFKDENKAVLWLKRENSALNHQVPLSLMDSEIGAEQVMIILGRIREGVYS